MHFQVLELIFAFQRQGVADAGAADVDTGYLRGGLAQGVARRLEVPQPATSTRRSSR